ncbi:hypothetical protein EDF62_1036 [Leucobacter luti]|uniref:DUF7341 domain-containing protein n=1 Tax=Leucobacter luti TaxID=340320 RepID=A0A4R6S728_9MICO|nr:hypothetical protein [Leucobacter luti]TDP94616.1 hypothetical protein EDF62_1036 [Leucobacter luti]
MGISLIRDFGYDERAIEVMAVRERSGAVERLTENHTMHLDGAEYECMALLEQLREAISSSTGSGSGGGIGDGGLINVAAFTLWEQIDGWARAWLREWGHDHKGELAAVIRRLPAKTQAAHAIGTIDDDLRERIDATYAVWVAKIEDLFDPPREKELTAPCPACGERYHEDGETRRAAVVIPVKVGRAIVAECRNCGTMWGTETDLLALAAGMGIAVDFTALRELVNSSN